MPKYLFLLHSIVISRERHLQEWIKKCAALPSNPDRCEDEFVCPSWRTLQIRVHNENLPLYFVQKWTVNRTSSSPNLDTMVWMRTAKKRLFLRTLPCGTYYTIKSFDASSSERILVHQFLTQSILIINIATNNRNNRWENSCVGCTRLQHQIIVAGIPSVRQRRLVETLCRREDIMVGFGSDGIGRQVLAKRAFPCAIV